MPVHKNEYSCSPIPQHAEAVVATLRTGLVPLRAEASLASQCFPFRAEGQHLLCVPITAYHAFECPDDAHAFACRCPRASQEPVTHDLRMHRDQRLRTSEERDSKDSSAGPEEQLETSRLRRWAASQWSLGCSYC